MKTSDFVEKYAGIKGKARTCASVVLDENGTIYSYGRHYPLLFEVENTSKTAKAFFVNDMGYSATTSKHIAYARYVARYSVELQGDGWNYNNIETGNILKCLEIEKQYIFIGVYIIRVIRLEPSNRPRFC